VIRVRYLLLGDDTAETGAHSAAVSLNVLLARRRERHDGAALRRAGPAMAVMAPEVTAR